MAQHAAQMPARRVAPDATFAPNPRRLLQLERVPCVSFGCRKTTGAVRAGAGGASSPKAPTLKVTRGRGTSSSWYTVQAARRVPLEERRDR